MIREIFSCELPKNKQSSCGSLSEYHAGYRAFSKELLEKLPIDQNSDDFVLDNQMLAQIDTDGIHALYVSFLNSITPYMEMILPPLEKGDRGGFFRWIAS